jgi:hypothetical protein
MRAFERAAMAQSYSPDDAGWERKLGGNMASGKAKISPVTQVTKDEAAPGGER